MIGVERKASRASAIAKPPPARAMACPYVAMSEESRDSRAAGPALRATLLPWYGRARRDLPWRRTRDAYSVWVSETMLQQTRVDTVIPFYERFLRELPTVHHLAEATRERVLSLWSGLGYYRRARMLHDAAKRAVAFHGAVPSELAELRELEGVGAYTAGAVASIAFGRRAAVVDGNVARVLARLFAIEDDVKTAGGRARLWRLAEELVSEGDGDPGDWNQALMELGATVCVPRQPDCGNCPVRDLCLARERGLAGQLPRAAPKRAPVAMRRVAIVLASSKAVLLARRRSDVLFGGLWEPPSAGGEVAALAARLGMDVRSLSRAGEVVHVLSHRRMLVEVFRGPVGRRVTWPLPGSDYDAIELVGFEHLGVRAQATLARKVLSVADVAAAL
jgi:A/G-specific adenine glycosylase